MTIALLPGQAEYFASLDPLLPEPVEPPDGELLTASLPNGDQVAGMLCSTILTPGLLPTLWSAMLTWELHPLLDGQDGATLDSLLRVWRQALDRAPSNLDSACQVTWPSRDHAASAPLLRHGFLPLTVLAVRTAPTEPRRDPTYERAAGVRVRLAGRRDIDTILGLSLAELAFSAQVGGAVLRQDAEEIKRTAIARHLDDGDPIWLAERDGVAVGHVECWITESVTGSWAETRLRHGRWGYVNCASVLPRVRGGGVGRALMATAHHALRANGATGTFLYFNPPNPLSSVFWARQGYRPLWTSWEIRPAGALR